MINFLALGLIFIAFLLSVLLIYFIYCLVTLLTFEKSIKNSTHSSIEEAKTRFNIFIWFLKKSRKVKDASSPDELKKAVKKKTKGFKIGILIFEGIGIQLVIKLIIYGITVYSLNIGLQTVASVIETLLNDDEQCQCYALCTGDSADDAKSVYELIFGPNEYNKLIHCMELTDEEYEKFYGEGRYGQELKLADSLSENIHLSNYTMVINTSNDGRAKSEFIRDHINNDMVNCYRDLVGDNSKFRFKDGLDRSKMTQKELEEDLYKLLSDYKINGRNPNCTCDTINIIGLDFACYGEKHWEPGWTWNFITNNDPDQFFSNTTGSGIMGKATGQYAVQLDDGTYFWYHQTSAPDNCVHCGQNDPLGNWSNKTWSASDKGTKTFGSNGCAVYSMAIGLSNLCGREITPTVIFQTTQSTVTTSHVKTNDSYFSGMSIRRGEFAKLMASAYNLNLSSHTKANNDDSSINDTISFIDSILAQGGIVWASWIDDESQWCGGSKSHFMCIRKTDGSNYYCFTSCKGKCASVGGKEGAIQTMNYPISKVECVKGIGYYNGESITHTQTIYGFINPNAPTEGGGGDAVITDPSSCYSTLSVSNGKVAEKAGNSSINIYDGWPWGNTSDLTFVNMEAYKNLIEGDIKSYTGLSSLHTNNGWYAAEDYACATTGRKDGINCLPIVWHSIWGSKTFYSEQWANLSSAKPVIGYNGQYAAILLQNKTDGKKYFLPIIGSDSKRHTWPGGAVQTFIGKSTGNYEIANRIVDSSGTMDKNSIPGLTYVGKGPNGDYGKTDGALFSGDAKTVMTYAFSNTTPHVAYNGYGLAYSYEMNSANISTWNTIRSKYNILGVVIQGL